MDIATLVAVLSQLTLAAAAWRLANKLAGRVEDLDKRVVVLETVRKI